MAIGEPTTEQRTDHRRKTEYSTDKPLPLTALTSSKQVADNSKRIRRNNTATYTLYGTPHNKLRHITASTTEK
ncbi:hypothetical protein D9M69_600210 [compost metagenome]